MSFTNLKNILIALFMILGLSMGSIAMAGDEYGEPDDTTDQDTAVPQQTTQPDEGEDDSWDEGDSGY